MITQGQREEKIELNGSLLAGLFFHRCVVAFVPPRLLACLQFQVDSLLRPTIGAFLSHSLSSETGMDR